MLRIEIHLFNDEVGAMSMEGVEDLMQRLADMMLDYHGPVNENGNMKSVLIAFDDTEADEMDPDEYFNTRIGGPGDPSNPVMFIITGSGSKEANGEETTT